MKKEQLDNVPVKKHTSLLWSILFVIIAIMCIYTMVGLNKGFSMESFMSFIKNGNVYWLCAAFFCMLVYIFSEALAIKVICKSLGYKVKNMGFFYSCADIYFSAITPSATGGQPISGYIMHKDGIPSSVVTACLLYNLQLYTLAVVLVSLVTLFINFGSFLDFSFFAKFLIIIGFIIQIGLVIIFSFLLYKRTMLHKICKWGLNILYKVHLIKDKEKQLNKLLKTMKKYEDCADLLLGKPAVFFKSLMLNVFQRVFILLVPICLYLAVFNNYSNLFNLWSIQTLVAIGATFIPIPGAMGVTDYLMLNGFSSLMDLTMATNLGLLSRMISFYSCAIICGIGTLVKFIMIRKGSKK